MSFNSDSSTSTSAAGTTRDWIFPSYSIHSPHNNINKVSRRRRYSTHQTPQPQFKFNSQTAFSYSGKDGDRCNSVGSSFSRSVRQPFEFGNFNKSTRLLDDDLSGSRNVGIDAISAVDVKTIKPSPKSFAASLSSVLRFTATDQISKLTGRLKLCNLYDSIDIIYSSTVDVSSDELPSRSLKVAALAVSILLLSLPFLFFKYVDYVSNARRSVENGTEGVSLNKQLAYRVDLFLSVNPYAKPLALLVATLLLICLGGLALFGVTSDGLADSLWLSWTYVADSGNHTNSEGIGPRLVSVCMFWWNAYLCNDAWTCF